MTLQAGVRALRLDILARMQTDVILGSPALPLDSAPCGKDTQSFPDARHDIL